MTTEMAADIAKSLIAKDLPIIEDGKIKNSSLYHAAISKGVNCIALSKNIFDFEDCFSFPFDFKGGEHINKVSENICGLELLHPVTKWGVDVPEGYYIGVIARDTELKPDQVDVNSKAYNLAMSSLESTYRCSFQLYSSAHFSRLIRSEYFKSLLSTNERRAKIVVSSYSRFISPGYAADRSIVNNKIESEMSLYAINLIGRSLKENLGIKIDRDYYLLSASSIDSFYEEGAKSEEGKKLIPVVNGKPIATMAKLNEFTSGLDERLYGPKLYSMNVDFEGLFKYTLGIRSTLKEIMTKAGREKRNPLLVEMYKEHLRGMDFKDIVRYAEKEGSQEVWDTLNEIFPEERKAFRGKATLKSMSRNISNDFDI